VHPHQVSNVQLGDDDADNSSKQEIMDDSDVVIQIYDSNETNPDKLTPPMAAEGDNGDLFL